MKIQTNIKKNKRKALCLVLLSTMLHGCVGGTSSDSANGGKTQPSNYLGDGAPGEEHAKPDKDQIKDKEKRKKELYEKLKNHGTASVNQRNEIDKILSKLPLHLLDAHAEKDGTIEFVTGDWKSNLNKYGIDTNQEFMDYTGETIGAQSLAHAVEINGELKLLVRADEGINYANDGDNRKRLYYAAVKGLMSAHDVETDAELVALLKETQGTPGARYLDHPSISELLNLANGSILNEQNQEAVENSLAYLLANYAEDPEMLRNFLPNIAEYLDKLDHSASSGEETIIEHPEVIGQYETRGRSSPIKDWGKFSDSCFRAGGECKVQEFKRATHRVAGYEIEVRDTRLPSETRYTDQEGNQHNQEIFMDLELAASNDISNGTGMPKIKFVVETIDAVRLIEIVTAPLTETEIASPVFKDVIRILATKFSTPSEKVYLSKFISEYNQALNEKIAEYGGKDKDKETIDEYRSYQMTLNEKFSQLEFTIQPKTNKYNYMFQQANIMVDLYSIFSRDEKKQDAVKKLFTTDIGRTDYYPYLDEAIKLGDYFKNLGSNDSANNIAPKKNIDIFYKHAIYNLLARLGHIKASPETEIEQNVFFRHSHEDIIYSVLKKDEIDAILKQTPFIDKHDQQSTLFIMELYKSIARLNIIANRTIEKIQKDKGLKINLEQFTYYENSPNLDKPGLYKYRDRYFQVTSDKERNDLKIRSGQNIDVLLERLKNDPKISEDTLYEYFTGVESKILKTVDKYFYKLFEIVEKRKGQDPKTINEVSISLGLQGTRKRYTIEGDKPGGDGSPYTMPRPWGHLPLLVVKGKQDQLYSVVELRGVNGDIARYNLTQHSNSKPNSFSTTLLKNFYDALDKN